MVGLFEVKLNDYELLINSSSKNSFWVVYFFRVSQIFHTFGTNQIQSACENKTLLFISKLSNRWHFLTRKE